MKDLNLYSILKNQLVHLYGPAEVSIKSIQEDHRKVEAGDVFIAIKGQSFDGHQVLEEVEKRQPRAIIFQQDWRPSSSAITALQVKDSRKARLQLARALYGEPVDELFAAGVTGTNGKTTVTKMAECVLQSMGLSVGIMGTLYNKFNDQTHTTQTTTPSLIQFYEQTRKWKNQGCEVLLIETSSHALEQERLGQPAFDVGVFMNLTRDHFDYHQDFSSYYEAKKLLFTNLLKNSNKKNKVAIINIDDEFGLKLANELQLTCWTFGKRPDADYRIEITHQDFFAIEFDLYAGKDKFKVNVPVICDYNSYNAVAAILIAKAHGIQISQSIQALGKFTGTPGRVESVPNNKGLHVFVDYAHTDGALKNVLQNLIKTRDQVGKGKIWTVFGCGGDRDTGKRPLMAKVAQELSDYVVITSDNPRTESPESIIKDILTGIECKERIYVEVDRKRAIQLALEKSQKDDIVLIAGKGHETYQILQTQVTHFDDREVAREALSVYFR